MTDREARIETGTFVTGICRGDRIAFRQGPGHERIPDLSGVTAVPDRNELAVPALDRQPELECNVRIGYRLHVPDHAAERGEVLERWYRPHREFEWFVRDIAA